VRILGFDTATRATTVALLDTDDAAVAARRDDPPPGRRPRHTTQLMPLVVEVLGAGHSAWSDIDLIAVGVGPGTFTGLRIGVATAHALARARAIPLVGVSTLQSLASAAAAGVSPPQDAVMAVLDARRAEVFAAGWAVTDASSTDAEPLLRPAALAPEALAEVMRQSRRRWLVVGDGAVEFRAILERSGARIPEDDAELHRVSAIEHCRLARGLPPQAPDAVRPAYLRLPDAEISLRAAQRQ
jgi:tRNA threonylcarbamoyladenosine biosynthesis protein TsaB